MSSGLILHLHDPTRSRLLIILPSLQRTFIQTVQRGIAVRLTLLSNNVLEDLGARAPRLIPTLPRIPG